MMGISETDFWESTPRKIIALIDQKNRIEKIKQKNQAIYIAYCVWGKPLPNDEDIDEIKPVAGRDVPIDPTALKGLMM
jgi:hypothetical protein